MQAPLFTQLSYVLIFIKVQSSKVMIAPEEIYIQKYTWHDKQQHYTIHNIYVGRMEDRLYPVLSKSGEADMMDAIISSIEHSFNSL